MGSRGLKGGSKWVHSQTGMFPECCSRPLLSAAPPVVTNSQVYLGCRYAMGWYACERPDGWLYQHDGVVSVFMASNAIARKNDGSWSAVTILANKDATVEIVHLVRDVVDIVRSSSSVPGAVLRSSRRWYRTCCEEVFHDQNHSGSSKRQRDGRGRFRNRARRCAPVQSPS